MINIEFNSILQLLKAFPDEQACIDHLTELRWNGNVVSPFDADSKVYTCKGNKYKCKNTGKYFNVKTATLFDSSKIPLQKWFLGIYLLTSHKKGISSVELSRELGLTQKSAWFMAHRIRACFGMDDEKKLGGDDGGIVEVDETYHGGKDKNRHANKKKGLKDRKVPIIGMRERGGLTKAKSVKAPTAKEILPVVLGNLKHESIVFTDELRVYRKLYESHQHETVNHRSKEYVRGDVHTNGIENFWSIFKRGVFGVYHFMSEKHLQKYLDEFTFRYNSRTCDTTFAMNYFFQHTGVRTSYKKLVNG